MKYTRAVIVLLSILGCLVYVVPAARNSPLVVDSTFSNDYLPYKAPSIAKNAVFSGAGPNTGLGVYMTAAEDVCVTDFVLFVKANSFDLEDIKATPVIYSTADSSEPVFTGEALSLPTSTDFSAIKFKVEPCFQMEYGVSAVLGLNIENSSSRKSFTMKTVKREQPHNVATIATISNKGVALVSNKNADISVDFAIIQHGTSLYQSRFVEFVEDVEATEPGATVPPVSTEAPEVQTTPAGTTPEGTTPAGTTPEGTTPEATTPGQTTEEATTTQQSGASTEAATSTAAASTSTEAATTTQGTTTTSTAAAFAPSVTAATFVQTVGGFTTITGQHFGSDASVVTVSIDSAQCTDVSVVIADTQIRCYIGAGTGKNKRISVAVNGVSNTDANTAFSRIAPSVTGISVSGSTVTIQGNNLGNNAAVVAVSAGTVSLPVTAAGHTSVTCTVPAGTDLQALSSAGRLTVSLSVDGQAVSATVNLDIIDDNTTGGEDVNAATTPLLSLSLAALLALATLFVNM